MVCERAIASCNGRPLGVGSAVAVSLAVAVLGVRSIESSGDPVGFVRIVVSAASIAAFFLVRRQSLVKSLLLALAIEVTAGSTIFALVDLPFIRAHAAEITRTSLAVMNELAGDRATASVALR